MSATLRPAEVDALLKGLVDEKRKAEEPLLAQKRLVILPKHQAERAALVAEHKRKKKSAEAMYPKLAAIHAQGAEVAAELNAIERDADLLSDRINRLDNEVRVAVGPLGGAAIDAVLPRLLRAAREAQGGIVYTPEYSLYGTQIGAVLRTPELARHAEAMRAWAGRLESARLDEKISPAEIAILCEQAAAAIAAGPAVASAGTPEFRFPANSEGLQ